MSTTEPSRGPLTNLHLGNRRLPAQAWQRADVDAAIASTVAQAASAFAGCRMIGFDLIQRAGRCHVLEANGVAYGCSTRNGGQAQVSSGRLKRSQWVERWGLDVAKGMHAEVCEGFDLFRGLIRDHAIDCEPQDGGHYYIAHKASVVPTLEKEAALLRDTFGYGAKMLSRSELHETVVRDMEAHGAMWEPDGVGIHAAKLAFGYCRIARELAFEPQIDLAAGWPAAAPFAHAALQWRRRPMRRVTCIRA